MRRDDTAGPRLLVFGNSGSGKTTLARSLAKIESIPHLDLDQLAWDPGPKRRPLERSREEILQFVTRRHAWIVEGCYGDLIEVVAPFCTRLVFLNPGIKACVANCLQRPWEPEKYPDPAAQRAKLEFLLDWVRSYEVRDDEFSLVRHRAIFEDFPGEKIEMGLRAGPTLERIREWL